MRLVDVFTVFDKQKIANIDKKSQMIVYGYIHEQERLLDMEIVEAIILICILFYQHPSDEWYPDSIGYHCEILAKTKVHFKAHSGWQTAYGSHIVKLGEVHEWKLRMEEYDTEKAEENPVSSRILIGICSDTVNQILTLIITLFIKH